MELSMTYIFTLPITMLCISFFGFFKSKYHSDDVHRELSEFFKRTSRKHELGRIFELYCFLTAVDIYQALAAHLTQRERDIVKANHINAVIFILIINIVPTVIFILSLRWVF